MFEILNEWIKTLKKKQTISPAEHNGPRKYNKRLWNEKKNPQQG